MATVTETEFYDFVKANASGEAETEKDVEYSYEKFFDADGNEIAFAAYHSYKGASYHLVDSTDKAKS